MRKLIFFLVLLLCVSPVMAQTVSFTASSDEAVWAVYVSAPYGSTGTIQLTLENGDVINGDWSYAGLPAGASINLESESTSYSYALTFPARLWIGVWNGDNSTYYRNIGMGIGQVKPVWNDVITTQISRTPTVSYVVSSSSVIVVEDEIIEREEAAKNLKDPSQDANLVKLLEASAWIIVDVFTSLIYWLKFLFIDNLLLTISLYMAGSLAYAANTSRNIFSLYKTWFRQQRSMFEFVALGFQTVFQIVTQVAAVIGQAMATTASLIGTALAFVFKRF